MNNKTSKKIKLIYCMGSGRSGTTLLNILLGNHPEIFGPGEINNIPRLPEEKFNCSCGKRVANCEFWSDVFKDWKAAIGDTAFDEMVKNINRYENFKSPKAWLKAVVKYPGRQKYLKDYLENTYKFLEIIIKHSEKPVLVDISKNPLRALLLSQHPNIDLRLIHVIRDGRGVAWSLNRFTKVENKQRPVWRTALFWIIVNKQSSFVRRRVKNSIMLRYEDFVKFSESTLNKIGQMADINAQPVIDILKSEIALKDSHIMAGNRLRKEKTIKLKMDTGWKINMPVNKQIWFTQIARHTLKQYGYL